MDVPKRRDTYIQSPALSGTASRCPTYMIIQVVTSGNPVYYRGLWISTIGRSDYILIRRAKESKAALTAPFPAEYRGIPSCHPSQKYWTALSRRPGFPRDNVMMRECVKGSPAITTVLYVWESWDSIQAIDHVHRFQLLGLCQWFYHPKPQTVSQR